MKDHSIVGFKDEELDVIEKFKSDARYRSEEVQK
jgi:hypothetical protein